MVPARTMTLQCAWLACTLVLASAGCQRAAVTPAPANDAGAQSAFAMEQQAWRAQRLAEITKLEGWASLIGLHWLDPGPHRVGSDTDNGIRLAMGPEHLGVFSVRDGKVRFAPEQGVAIEVDGQPARGALVLRHDGSDAGPSRVGFDGGKGVATVIVRGGRFALRVKHADADSRVHFSGLDYWPGGLDWRIKGRFVPHPPGKTLPIANIIGTTDNLPNPGAVEFQHGGKAYRLEALDQGEGTLFLVFADRTSGHGSYGAGRFLDAPMPDAQGNVMLDFNQGYNPPCAFTPFATCPLPPPENRLDLTISAGERDYAKPASAKAAS